MNHLPGFVPSPTLGVEGVEGVDSVSSLCRETQGLNLSLSTQVDGTILGMGWDSVMDEVLQQITLERHFEGLDDEKMTAPDELTPFQQRRIVRVVDAAIEFNFAVTRNLGLATFDPRAPEPPTRSFQHDVFFALVRDVGVLYTLQQDVGPGITKAQFQQVMRQCKSHGSGKEILPLWLRTFCRERETQALVKLLSVAISLLVGCAETFAQPVGSPFTSVLRAPGCNVVRIRSNWH
ncbi:hypothetical protein NMY22_g17174 [Coprinellus aureogranulatus]|nr:hypothetical protein NMY22_g17174 [Coprinellus aureogranulatus]